MGNLKSYTHLHMEAVACLWEAMLEGRYAALRALWDNFGTVEMRHTAIALADDVLKVWDCMTEDEREKCVPYDWEFVPAFLRRIEFHNTGHHPITNHREFAELILSRA